MLTALKSSRTCQTAACLLKNTEQTTWELWGLPRSIHITEQTRCMLARGHHVRFGLPVDAASTTVWLSYVTSRACYKCLYILILLPCLLTASQDTVYIQDGFWLLRWILIYVIFSLMCFQDADAYWFISTQYKHMLVCSTLLLLRDVQHPVLKNLMHLLIYPDLI